MKRTGNNGAVPLSAYPSANVEIACGKCGRRGLLSKARLLAKHGDIALPELLMEIAADCPRASDPYHDRCGAYYPVLKR